MKRFKRGPGAWVGFLLLALLSGTLKAVPERVAQTLGRTLGCFMLHLAGPRKRIALGNLKIALGHLTELEERKRIFKKFMLHLGLTMVELGHPQLMSEDSLRRRIAVQGLEHVERAHKEGKGLILATAHFGNFPLILVRLALEGYPLGVIVRHPRHRPVAKSLGKWLARWGVRIFRDKPRWTVVREALSFLREEGILVIHTDLNVSKGSMFVPFFGKWVPTFPGPATLALRTGAVILPTFIRRICGFNHRVTVGPPISLNLSGKRGEDVWRITLALSQITQDTISRFPDQWWWIHRRFRKARPEEEVGRSIPSLLTPS